MAPLETSQAISLLHWAYTDRAAIYIYIKTVGASKNTILLLLLTGFTGHGHTSLLLSNQTPF